LARSVTEAFRAVKVVYRNSFEHERPFLREFEGILKFEPISRTDESQVDILHVGRGQDCFYYVMELADDQTTGGQIHPEKYTPRTLKSDLLFRHRLPFEECVQIGIALARALEHLHENGLVHRDVKPSNIIFINGVPKLADIGLVTGLDATRSHVGTEGFAAPEGPGTPRADLYSLGKVLYEAATGKDRQEFPELPTELRELPDREGLVELNGVIARACRHDPQDRYASASAMRSDLELLRSGKSLARLRRTEARLRSVQRAGAAVTALAALVATGWFWQGHEMRLLRDLAAEKTQLLLREKAAHDAAKAAEQSTLKQLDRAVAAENEARAALDFIQTNIIAAARPQTELGGLGRDVTVLQALQRADQKISAFFSGQPLVEAQLRLEMGETYALLGDLPRAIVQYEQGVALRKRELGPEDLLTLDATASLADILVWEGRMDESVRLLEQCVKYAQARANAGGQPTLDFLTRLGLAYRAAENNAAAIAALERACDLSRRALGLDDPGTLQILNHLAVTHQRAGHLTQAAALLEQVRDRRSQVLGLEDETTTCVMIDLARAYQELGRWDEARPLFETALATRRRVKGADHYATLIALDSLMDAFHKANLFAEAKPFGDEALRLREAKLGPGHPETLATCRNLAWLVVDWIRTECPTVAGTNTDKLLPCAAHARDAERFSRRCFDTESKVYPADDARLVDDRTVLGASLVALAASEPSSNLSPRLARLREAEALLLTAHRDIQPAKPAAQLRSRSSLRFLIQLYETWELLEPGTGKQQQVLAWQRELLKLDAPAAETPAQPGKPASPLHASAP
jgi:tetratricopeptide (TPR) repeat protein